MAVRQASPTQAYSLDNPELFQEESSKKINRLGPADGQITRPYPQGKAREGPFGDRKVPKCVRGKEGGAGGVPRSCAAAGEGAACPLSLDMDVRKSPHASYGRWEFPEVTPKPGDPNPICSSRV